MQGGCGLLFLSFQVCDDQVVVGQFLALACDNTSSSSHPLDKSRSEAVHGLVLFGHHMALHAMVRVSWDLEIFGIVKPQPQCGASSDFTCDKAVLVANPVLDSLCRCRKVVGRSICIKQIRLALDVSHSSHHLYACLDVDLAMCVKDSNHIVHIVLNVVVYSDTDGGSMDEIIKVGHNGVDVLADVPLLALLRVLGHTFALEACFG